MKTVKNCLFGGALVGAGLCSQAQAAAEFNWLSSSDNFTHLSGNMMQYFNTGSGWSEYSSDGASYSSMTGTDFALSMATNSDGANDFARADHFNGVYFEVTEDTAVDFEWDFSGSNSSSYFALIGPVVGLNNDGGAVSGSFSLDLIAGDVYWIQASVFSRDGNGLSFFNMTVDNSVSVVPLPPAAIAGLGMLAGLGAYRRVRR